QEHIEDLAAGLPVGTPVALKNGWIMGVRHAAGIVYPPGEAPYVLAVCTSTPLAINEQGDEACQLVARISAAALAARVTLPYTATRSGLYRLEEMGSQQVQGRLVQTEPVAQVPVHPPEQRVDLVERGRHVLRPGLQQRERRLRIGHPLAEDRQQVL